MGARKPVQHTVRCRDQVAAVCLLVVLSACVLAWLSGGVDPSFWLTPLILSLGVVTALHAFGIFEVAREAGKLTRDQRFDLGLNVAVALLTVGATLFIILA